MNYNNNNKPVPVCMFDPGCYRKNPQHFKDYAHPQQDAQKRQQQPQNQNQQHQQQQQQQHKPPQQNLQQQQRPIHENHPLPQKDHSNSVKVNNVANDSNNVHTHNNNNNIVVPPQQPQQQHHAPNLLHSSPAPRKSSTVAGGTTPFGGGGSPSKPNQNNDNNNNNNSFIQRPQPRQSPLKGSNDPCEVFEMPFPIQEMKLILDIAKHHQQQQNNSNAGASPLRAYPGIVLAGPFEILLNGANFDSDRRKWMFHRQPLHPPEVQTFAYVEPNLFSRVFGIRLHKNYPVVPNNNSNNNQNQNAVSGERRERDDNNNHNNNNNEQNNNKLISSWPTLCFFRDDPKEQPFCVVSYGLGGREIKAIHQSCSRVICYLLREFLGASNNNNNNNQPQQPQEISPSTQITRVLYNNVFKEALHEASQVGKEMTTFDRDRSRKAIGKTLSGIGIVVPYEKDSELGYRVPHVKATQLAVLLGKMNNGTHSSKDLSELDDQLRWADIANDECDFGMGLEVGLNFLHECKLDAAETRILNGYVFSNCVRMLDICYDLLQRDIYKHIIAVEAFTYRAAK